MCIKNGHFCKRKNLEVTDFKKNILCKLLIFIGFCARYPHSPHKDVVVKSHESWQILV